MQRPPWQSYRRELAGRLQQEPEHQKRRAMLEEARISEAYQKAHALDQEERQRWYALVEHLAEESTDPVAAQQRAKILEGSADLAALITRKFPQRNPDGSLHYYLVGSLGTTLLAQAQRFTTFKSERLTQLEKEEVREIPEKARQALAQFARLIGDIDFVRLEKRREVDLGKGGGSIFMDELTPAMEGALADTSTHSIFTEPVDPDVSPQPIHLELPQGEFYVAHPLDMLRIKAVHIAQNFGAQPTKAKKFLQDFTTLRRTLETLGYTRRELVQMAHDTLVQSLPDLPNIAHVPFQSALFGGDGKRFFEEVIACDPDVEYLKQLPWAKERAIGIYKVLRRFESPQLKQRTIDFLKAHREQVDIWRAVGGGELNRERLAMALYNAPDLRADFAQRVRIEEPTVVAFRKALEINVWAFREYAQRVPPEALPEQIPAESSLLEVLVHVQPEYAESELSVVDAMLRKFGDLEYGLEKLFRDPSLSTTYSRERVTALLEQALTKIDDKARWRSFLFKLGKYVTEQSIYDDQTHQPLRLEEARRVALVRKLCEEYDIAA